MEKVKKFVTGTCLDMCPHAEIKMREREKLLHLLEMMPGTEKNRLPRASKAHMVKCFSRSAAGKQIKVENLRPPKVLLKTVKYLLYDVIATKILPFHAVYDFITDRLMAVRQDMVVQNVSKAECITILQPIVRFHAYAAYKLCEQSTNNFDPTLNNNHLQECLKRLLHCFDYYDHLLELDCNTECNSYILETRPEFEALYLIFNLGNDEALQRSLTIPKECRTDIVTKAIKVSYCFKYGNYVHLCRLVEELPLLLAAVAALHLPAIRRKALQTMSVAYHSTNLSFPLSVLRQILLYGAESQLVADCEYYNIKVSADSVYFSKNGFATDKTVIPSRLEKFVDQKTLGTNTQTVVLGG